MYEKGCETHFLWKFVWKKRFVGPWTVHGAHWKALSTAYFAGQEVVGIMHSVRDSMIDVMEHFSIKNK